MHINFTNVCLDYCLILLPIVDDDEDKLSEMTHGYKHIYYSNEHSGCACLNKCI